MRWPTTSFEQCWRKLSRKRPPPTPPRRLPRAKRVEETKQSGEALRERVLPRLQAAKDEWQGQLELTAETAEEHRKEFHCLSAWDGSAPKSLSVSSLNMGCAASDGCFEPSLLGCTAKADGSLQCGLLSRMSIATTVPDRNVNAAIDVIADESPKRSAMRPAESAPIA